MTKVNKENWEYKKLGEICESIFSGGTPSRSIFSYWNGNIPWAKICDLRFMYLDKCEEFISKEGLANSSAKIFTKGTILYSIFATIGSSSILNIDASCNQAIAGIKLKSGLNTQFYFYVLKHLKSHFESISKGVAQKNINLSILKNQVVPVPPIEEQNRISSQFEEIDNLITIKQEQLKEFDALEQSVFYKMFGDSVVKEMGWEVKSLGEIGNIITGSTPSTKDKENYEPKEYCFVKPSDLPSKGVANITTTEYFVSSKGFALSRALPIGSVLISCIGTIGKIGILKQVACSNQQINAIIPNRTIDSYYLAYNIAVNKNKLESMANAPVVPIINKTSFSLFKIAIPPLTLQQSFAQKIEVIEKQKEVVKNEIAQLQALLDSEMDKYFG